MMHGLSIIAASGALLAAAAASPAQHQHQHLHQHHQRDVVWVTQTVEDVVTIPVTETVWVTPGQIIPIETHSELAPAPSAPASEDPPSAPPAAAATSTPQTTFSIAAATPAALAPSQPAVQAPAPAASSAEPVVPAAAPTSTASPLATVVTTAPQAASTTSPAAAPAPSQQAPDSQTPAGVFSDNDVGDMAGLDYGLAAAGTEYTGDFTNFTPGLGACGFTNTSTQAIVAISHLIFDSYTSTHDGPNGNPVCGRTLTVYGWNGTEIQAEVVDRCPVCDEGALDMTINLFNYATNTGNGRVHGMKWKWN